MSESISPSPSGAQWWRQDKTELVAALRERERLVCRAQAETYEILAEMQSRGPLAEFGYGSLEALLSDVLTISRRDAKHRTRRALALLPTQGITGTTVPALAPATAEAAAEGAVGVEHIDTVLDILRRIPDDIPTEERDGYEKALVDYARVATPSSVAKLGREVLVRVDPDGTLPSEKELERPDRELNTTWTRTGHLNLRGRLDRESGQALEAALSPLSKPRPAEDGTRDTRTPGERNGDALAEIVDHVLREDSLPTEAGTRPTVTVVLDYNKLLDGLRTVGTINGTDPSPPSKPAASPAIARSSPPCSARRARSSTSVVVNASSAGRNAARSTCETADAPCPAAHVQPVGRRHIMSKRGCFSASPTFRISASYVPNTTA